MLVANARITQPLLGFIAKICFWFDTWIFVRVLVGFVFLSCHAWFLKSPCTGNSIFGERDNFIAESLWCLSYDFFVEEPE